MLHLRSAHACARSPCWLIFAAALAIGTGCIEEARLGYDRLLPPPVQLDASTTPAAVDAPSDTLDAAVRPSNELDAADATSALGLVIQVAGAPASDVTISCPSTCVDVELVAQGGVAPYEFRWNDAVTTASRSVCPMSDTLWTADVTDHDGQTTSTAIQVQVKPCPGSGTMCIQNPSLEGTSVLGTEWFTGDTWDASAWDSCRTSNTSISSHVVSALSTLNPTMPFPGPTDGASYVYLDANGSQQQDIGQTLCAPLLAYATYHLELDLASAPTDSMAATLGSAQLQIYASSLTCARDELLWTSPPLSYNWQTSCVTLKPTQDATALVLNAIAPNGKAAALVDHLVPVDACP